MLFKIPALIEHVSSIMTLEVGFFRLLFPSHTPSCHDEGLTLPPSLFQTGDVILTGTPSGVGQVKPGDKVDCKLEDNSTGVVLAKFEFGAVERNGRYEFKE